MNEVVGLELGFVLAFLCSRFRTSFFVFLHMANHALMSFNIHFMNILRFELTLTFRQVRLIFMVDF
jgi:hypothetical protein